MNLARTTVLQEEQQRPLQHSSSNASMSLEEINIDSSMEDRCTKDRSLAAEAADCVVTDLSAICGTNLKVNLDDSARTAQTAEMDSSFNSRFDSPSVSVRRERIEELYGEVSEIDVDEFVEHLAAINTTCDLLGSKWVNQTGTMYDPSASFGFSWHCVRDQRIEEIHEKSENSSTVSEISV